MFIQQKSTLMISKSLLFCADIKKLHFYNMHFPENEMQSLYFFAQISGLRFDLFPPLDIRKKCLGSFYK